MRIPAMNVMSRSTLMLPFLLILCGFQAPGPAYPEKGDFERLDPDFDELVPTDARLEILSTGFIWSEGPAWRKSGGYLVFSDVIGNTIYQWSEDLGIRVFLRPSGYMWPDPPGHELGTNGLTFDADDRLVFADHGNRRIARLNEADVTKETLVSHYDGRRLNSPNDLVIHSNGDIYFTDPPFGLDDLLDSPDKELDFQGVYRLTPDTGELTLLTDELRFPNGIALSPDEGTLYVSVTREDSVIMAYDVQDDGTVANGRVFFDAASVSGPGIPGFPDGMVVDREGNLFATGPGGVLVLAPDGRHLGTIYTGQPTGNATFGDDGSTLYITSNHDLLRVRLSTVGLGF